MKLADYYCSETRNVEPSIKSVTPIRMVFRHIVWHEFFAVSRIMGGRGAANRFVHNR
jgi:hypothetical protein